MVGEQLGSDGKNDLTAKKTTEERTTRVGSDKRRAGKSCLWEGVEQMRIHSNGTTTRDIPMADKQNPNLDLFWKTTS